MEKLLSNVAQVSDSSEAEVPLAAAAKDVMRPEAVPQLNLRNLAQESDILITESSEIVPQVKAHPSSRSCTCSGCDEP